MNTFSRHVFFIKYSSNKLFATAYLNLVSFFSGEKSILIFFYTKSSHHLNKDISFIKAELRPSLLTHCVHDPLYLHTDGSRFKHGEELYLHELTESVGASPWRPSNHRVCTR